MNGRLVAVATALLLVLASVAAGEAPGGEGSAATAGQALYEQHCLTCHGAEGKGDGPAGRELLPMPRDFSVGAFKFDADADGRAGTDDDLFLVIRDGAAVVGGNPVMVPWGWLGDEAIRQLVHYVRGLERPR